MVELEKEIEKAQAFAEQENITFPWGKMTTRSNLLGIHRSIKALKLIDKLRERLEHERKKRDGTLPDARRQALINETSAAVDKEMEEAEGRLKSITERSSSEAQTKREQAAKAEDPMEGTSQAGKSMHNRLAPPSSQAALPRCHRP